jgi:integrase
VVQTKWPLHLPELDLAINTGLRKGSQYGMTWDMVDWKSRMSNISRTKNDEAVHVPLNDAAVAALKAVFDRGDGRGRVFRSGKTGERSKMRGIGLMTRSLTPSSRTFIGMICDARLQAGCE